MGNTDDRVPCTGSHSYAGKNLRLRSRESSGHFSRWSSTNNSYGDATVNSREGSSVARNERCIDIVACRAVVIYLTRSLPNVPVGKFFVADCNASRGNFTLRYFHPSRCISYACKILFPRERKKKKYICPLAGFLPVLTLARIHFVGRRPSRLFFPCTYTRKIFTSSEERLFVFSLHFSHLQDFISSGGRPSRSILLLLTPCEILRYRKKASMGFFFSYFLRLRDFLL